MSKALSQELVPVLQKLWEALKTEPDPVKQQMCIELLALRHAVSFEDKAEFVLDSMHKHTKQLFSVWREDHRDNTITGKMMRQLDEWEQ